MRLGGSVDVNIHLGLLDEFSVTYYPEGEYSPIRKEYWAVKLSDHVIVFADRDDLKKLKGLIDAELERPDTRSKEEDKEVVDGPPVQPAPSGSHPDTEGWGLR